MEKPEFLRRIYYGINYRMFEFYPEFIIKRRFKRAVGYDLNLDNPQTFNEKLQWLKLYWRDTRVTQLVDKYQVRDYVRSKGLGHLLNELYGVFDDPNEIDISKLPDKFVIKPNHTSGNVIFCRNKNEFNWTAAKKQLSKWLKRDYYRESLEWVYKDIQPKILIEKLIETKDNKPPRDYKIFCFSGKAKCLFVATERGPHTTKFDFFDLEWNRWPVKNHYPNYQGVIPKPEKLGEMINYAEILSDDFPHMRVDFYYEDAKIIFGECTFFHFSGTEPFEPKEYDFKLGAFLQLPEKKK